MTKVQTVKASSAGGYKGDPAVSGSVIRRLYRGQTNFDFINRWKIWFAASGAVIVLGLIALGAGGLNFSIDFKGGTVWQVPATASVATVRADLSHLGGDLSQATITRLTNRETGKANIQVQAPAKTTSDTTLVKRVTTELAKIGHVPQQDVTVNAIGPSWGSSITSKAVKAVVVFLILISIAISMYFESKMAIAALVALLHDMLITVGIYALSGFQVSPDTVIAFLTVLGYSLYDTIVVFDKVKENTKGLASTNKVTYTDVVNLSMNQVLARSINTSFVAIMPVFCILVIGSWILGATALNDFGLALFIGLMSGAYSSIFIASPLLALLKEREPRYVEIRRRLAMYPQSRQRITAATVSHGELFGPRTSVAPASPKKAEAGSGPGAAAPVHTVGGNSGYGAAPASVGARTVPEATVPGSTVPGSTVPGATAVGAAGWRPVERGLEGGGLAGTDLGAGSAAAGAGGPEGGNTGAGMAAGSPPFSGVAGGPGLGAAPAVGTGAGVPRRPAPPKARKKAARKR
ncbi:MAG TPA: protein translocase subunit SecF [Acidimicrobiales bacterium]|nr:protein translocase subunit SecF [Acidimicrobiales bacterium]